MNMPTEGSLQSGGTGSQRVLIERVSSGQARLKDPLTVYAVSKLRLNGEGLVTEVLWGQVDTEKNGWATDEAVAPVQDVVEAIHHGDAVFALFPTDLGHLPERRFIVVEHDNGWESIVLEPNPAFQRELHDMDRLDV